jgi:hypothetical protein
MISRRGMIKTMAASALLPAVALRAQGRVITTPIAVQENRIWIAASIGGSRPLQFIIDSGAVVSLIQERIAGELGLRARGRTRQDGTSRSAAARSSTAWSSGPCLPASCSDAKRRAHSPPA